MSFLKAPKINRYFWTFHLLAWGGLSLVNMFSRQLINAEDLQQGLVTALVMVLANTALCLIFREFIHRFNWLDVRKPSSPS